MSNSHFSFMYVFAKLTKLVAVLTFRLMISIINCYLLTYLGNVSHTYNSQ